jgi:hypothetical protein
MCEVEEPMKRLVTIAVAAVSLGMAGHGTVRAAGEPDSNPRDAGSGAVPGHQFGTSSDVAAKKQLNARKYQNTPPQSGTEARREPSTSGQKQ